MTNQPTATDEKLKPCPFCASRDIFYDGDHVYDSYVRIECAECGTQFDFAGTKIASTKRWQARASMDALSREDLYDIHARLDYVATHIRAKDVYDDGEILLAADRLARILAALNEGEAK